MHRVYHFEINSDDPEKTAEFYSEVFGWTINKKWAGDEDYWLVHTGPSDERGINGGIKKRALPKPAMVNCIEVRNIDHMIKKVVEKGGKLLEKITIPATGYLAYCQDPEGILFSMMEKSMEAE